MFLFCTAGIQLKKKKKLKFNHVEKNWLNKTRRRFSPSPNFHYYIGMRKIRKTTPAPALLPNNTSKTPLAVVYNPDRNHISASRGVSSPRILFPVSDPNIKSGFDLRYAHSARFYPVSFLFAPRILDARDALFTW